MEPANKDIMQREDCLNQTSFLETKMELSQLAEKADKRNKGVCEI